MIHYAIREYCLRINFINNYPLLGQSVLSVIIVRRSNSKAGKAGPERTLAKNRMYFGFPHLFYLIAKRVYRSGEGDFTLTA